MNTHIILQMIWQIIPYGATLVLYTTLFHTECLYYADEANYFDEFYNRAQHYSY